MDRPSFGTHIGYEGLKAHKKLYMSSLIFEMDELTQSCLMMKCEWEFITDHIPDKPFILEHLNCSQDNSEEEKTGILTMEQLNLLKASRIRDFCKSANIKELYKDAIESEAVSFQNKMLNFKDMTVDSIQEVKAICKQWV